MSVAARGGQELLDVISDPGRLTQHFGLPKAEDAPARRAERRGILTIPRDVPLDLGGPVSRVVAAGDPLETVRQVASVPEVAIAEDHEPRSQKHDVGAPWQPRDVKTIAEAPAPKLTAKGEFAARVRLGTGTSRCFRGAPRSRA